MGQFIIKTQAQILERMINRVVARTELSDINDGSSLKQVLAAASREDDDQYFQMKNLQDLFDIAKARGDDLDQRAKELNPNMITRWLASRSTGSVVFSRTGTTGTITIPIGTQVQVPATASTSPIIFSTTQVGTIAAGFTSSGLVGVNCNQEGTVGNVDINTIIGFVTKPSGVNSVTNPVGTSGGQNKELDDSYRQRIYAFIKSLARCHVIGLESGVMNLEDSVTGRRVIFSQLVEDILVPGRAILYIDDGTGLLSTEYTAVASEILIASALGGEVDFSTTNKPIRYDLGYILKKNLVTQVLNTDYYLNPASGRIKLVNPLGTGDELRVEPYYYYNGLIGLAQKVIDGDPLNRAIYPGYRAGGVLVQVLSPQTIWLSVIANITVIDGYNQTTLASQVKSAISNYINSLGIGEDVVLAKLIKVAMAIPGMYDITFTEPSENRIVLDNQMARILASAITIS